jgi:hypothetical protein
VLDPRKVVIGRRFLSIPPETWTNFTGQRLR